MGSENLEDLDRNDIIDKLETIASNCINRQFPSDRSINITQSVGSMIDIPHENIQKRTDLLIEFNNSHNIPPKWRSQFRGCAFKLRLNSDKRHKHAYTLACYWKAGYQPILVAPGGVLIDESGEVPSFSWFVDFFYFGSALEIVSGDPLRFTKSGIVGSELILPGLGESLIRARTHES